MANLKVAFFGAAVRRNTYWPGLLALLQDIFFILSLAFVLIQTSRKSSQVATKRQTVQLLLAGDFYPKNFSHLSSFYEESTSA